LNPVTTTIHVGKDWMVVNKPAGMSIHNSPGTDLLSVLQSQHDSPQLFAVNRLDVVTSGLIIIASTADAVRRFATLAKDSGIIKTYLALVRNPGQKLVTAATGSWRHPLTNQAEGRQQPAGKASERVECCTKFEVEAASGNFAILSLVAVTGRKHQLRRHCALEDTPIIGDTRYGGKNEKWRNYERIALHSAKLEFVNPDNNQTLILESQLPADFFPSAGTRELFSRIHPSE
jgi:23S rRNA-/tRNA-specific pseudouridylate synthase